MAVQTQVHPKIVKKLQHHVFYVDDLARSKDFYIRLFDLQYRTASCFCAHHRMQEADAPCFQIVVSLFFSVICFWRNCLSS